MSSLSISASLDAHDDVARPRVSIVMPTLNQRPFIAEAVRSVLEQPVPTGGLELVVVDGESGDGTQDELVALAAAWPGRLRWVSQRDDGPAQAVNRAVALARGELIGWLNSDDLYAPGAIARAVMVLQARPEVVMVYGEGLHVDITGRYLERYPSRPPSAGLAAFRQGCYICQPTAFFRRAAFEAVGGLDEGLRAAFDFDLWLKMFARWPEGIAFVPEVQAHSRLHEGGITLRQRERVAFEGMTVVHRHLGAAPPEWLLTHVEERCATHLDAPGPAVDLASEVRRLIERVRGLTSPQGLARLDFCLREDRRLRVGDAHCHARIHADGWAAADDCELLVRRPPAGARALQVHARHESPLPGGLRLAVSGPDGQVRQLHVARRGPFLLELPVPQGPADERLVWRIRCAQAYVPSARLQAAPVERGLRRMLERLRPGEPAAPASSDDRRLGFVIDRVELVPALDQGATLVPAAAASPSESGCA